MTNHRSEALDQLRRVEQAREQINDLYLNDRARPDLVAPLHQAIGHGLKLAEIHATLAIAQGLVALGEDHLA